MLLEVLHVGELHGRAFSNILSLYDSGGAQLDFLGLIRLVDLVRLLHLRRSLVWLRLAHLFIILFVVLLRLLIQGRLLLAL